MSDTLTCPECGREAESVDDLEAGPELPEMEADEGGSIALYETRDLFFCPDCKRPLSVSRR